MKKKSPQKKSGSQSASKKSAKKSTNPYRFNVSRRDRINLLSGAWAAMRHLAPKYCSGGRLIRFEDGLGALQVAFQLRDDDANPELVKKHFGQFESLTHSEMQKHFENIYNLFGESLDLVKSPPCRLAAEWAAHCISTALDGSVMIPDDDPYYLGPPPKPGEECAVGPRIAITSAIATAALYKDKPLELVRIRMGLLRDPVAQKIGEAAKEFIQAAKQPNIPKDKVKDLENRAAFLGQFALLVEEKDMEKLNKLKSLISKDWLETAEEMMKDPSPYPVQ